MTLAVQIRSSDVHPSPSRTWVSPWGVACLLVLAVFIARVVYLFWLSPWELLGDEAYYWEWSRHLDLCYYEKGPGLAYLVAASVRVLGVSEGAVRLPMAVCSALAAWGVGRLTLGVSGGNARAALYAVVFFVLLPAFQANAQICTQDGPLILCWVALSATGLQLVRRWEDGAAGVSHWVVVAVLLGIASLLKQSALLFLLSPVAYAVVRRRQIVWTRRLVFHLAAATICYAAVVSPMIIWNARHGWPTFAHTLGHLGAAGGDHDVTSDRRFDPRWFLSTAGAQVGAFGPAAIVLMVLASRWAMRSWSADPARFRDRLWMLCCALPGIGFYLALSLTKPVLGNWPFPCFVTLVVLVGEMAAVELPRYRDRLEAWRAAGRVGGRPRTWFRSCWDVTVGYGLVAWMLLSFPVMLARLPVLGKTVQRGVLTKMTGHRAAAGPVQAARDAARVRTGREPLLVARYYMTAALYAFYLPDHPVVFNAGTQLGKRRTAYDYWADTDLTSPTLLGRDALLDGVGAYPWERVLRFGSSEPIDDGRFTLAHAYAGVRPAGDRVGHAIKARSDDER